MSGSHQGVEAPPLAASAGFSLTVIGVGYVGMALARSATEAGLRVAGYDICSATIAQLDRGRSHIRDIDDQTLAWMTGNGFTPTTDPATIGTADVVAICVPTPLDSSGEPDLQYVRAAASTVSRYLARGTLVILESTSYPGTTEETVLPILEQSGLRAGKEFNLAFSPERIDPANTTWGFRNTPKIVGGHTSWCGDRAELFYGKLVETVVRARGTKEAELAKLIENAYRFINISFINEIVVAARDMGVDLWNAIDCAATKPFGFEAFYPSAGVGGHCIPVDPSYLAYKARLAGHRLRFVDLANDINHRMPLHVVDRVTSLLIDSGHEVRGSRILLLGVAYKPNVNDDRGSPARAIACRLDSLGVDIRYHDPYFATWDCGRGALLHRVEDLESELAAATLTVVLQAHEDYSTELLRISRLIFDTSGRFDLAQMRRL